MVWRHEHYQRVCCRVGQRSNHLQPSRSVSDALWMLMNKAAKFNFRSQSLTSAVEIKEVCMFRNRSREKLAALQGENKCVCALSRRRTHCSLQTCHLEFWSLLQAQPHARGITPWPRVCVWAPRRACDRFLFQSETIGSSGLPANS